MADPISVRSIVTRPRADEVEVVEIFDGVTRDHIIIIRDAVNSMRTADLATVQVEIERKDWRLNVRATK
jgi:hypothetical protein